MIKKQMENKMKYTTTIIFLSVILFVPIFMLTYENTGKNNYSNAYYHERPSQEYGKKKSIQMYFSKEFQPIYETYFEEQLPAYGEMLAVNQYFQYYILQKEVIGGKFMYEGNLYQRNTFPDEYVASSEFVDNANAFGAYMDAPVYLSLIPRKESFIAGEHPYINEDAWNEYEEQVNNNMEQITTCEYANYEDEVIQSPEDYMPNDHHWSADAAYNWYANIVTVMGFEPLPKEAYTIEEVTKVGGGTYSNSITEYSNLTSSINYYSSPTQEYKTCTYMSNGEPTIINDMTYDNNPDYYLNLYLGYGKQDITCTNPYAQYDESVAVLADSFGRPTINFLLDTFTQVDYYYAPNEGTTKEQVEAIKNGSYDYIILLTYDNTARALPHMNELY